MQTSAADRSRAGRRTGPSGSDAAPLVDQPLLERLGVDIAPDLLLLALTHRSYAYEHGGLPHNERLEFLGDSILGKAVTLQLYRDYPDLVEGELAKRRSTLVSTVALADVAQRIGLGPFIRLGRGEELTGGREKASILADTVEALIGAAYLTVGDEESMALVHRLVAPLAAEPERFAGATDPKTSLQELAARRGAPAPRYTMAQEGPDHARRFTATVVVEGLVEASGEGTSKKTAEAQAALAAWTSLTTKG